MSKFLCIHTLPANALTREQVCQVADASQHDPSIRGYRSFLSLSEGKAACIIEGSDRKAVADWLNKMGLPVDSISRLEMEGERGEMRDVEPVEITAGISA